MPHVCPEIQDRSRRHFVWLPESVTLERLRVENLKSDLHVQSRQIHVRSHNTHPDPDMQSIHVHVVHV